MSFWFLPLLLITPSAAARDDVATQALKKVNAYRTAAGLKAVTLDPKLTRGCLAHAKYLAQNVDPLAGKPVNLHAEDPKRPAYTEEGLTAARNSQIHFFLGKGSPLDALDEYMATLFHRIGFIQPDLKRIGFAHFRFKGNRCYIVVNTGSGRSGDSRLFKKPVFYPADKQKSVPLAFAANEQPNPIPAEGRKTRAGYPITVTFPPTAKVTGAVASLKDGKGKRVPVWLSSPEKPAFRPEYQHNTICLIPKGKLRPGITYTVEVTAEVNDKEWQRTWSFTTTGANVKR